jgi:Beige/BEACH domain
MGGKDLSIDFFLWSFVILTNIILLSVQISNFEYLMELNTLAGRSYNDITQVSMLISFIRKFHLCWIM